MDGYVAAIGGWDEQRQRGWQRGWQRAGGA
jgi:hypothetical protein